MQGFGRGRVGDCGNDTNLCLQRIRSSFLWSVGCVGGPVLSASGLSVSHVRATWSIRVSRVSVVVSGSVVGVVGLVVSVSSGVLCSRGVGCRAVVVVVVVVVVVRINRNWDGIDQESLLLSISVGSKYPR